VNKNFTSMITVIVVIAVIALLVFWLIGLYNKLVRYKNNRENAFADIDVQLRQRNDLIPQLVSTVKGYATHEKDLLERITQARSAVMSAGSINDKMQADTQLTQALQGLKISVEAYPDLKANTNFLQLQEEISDIENKLAAARRYFNGATRELNNAVESFPANIIAKNFGFTRQPMYELSAEQRTTMDAPPQINF
jgi:LemA protein